MFEKNPDWRVVAVGTENGKSVLFLLDEKSRHELIVPTSALHMSKLAETGVRVRNIYDRKTRGA